MSEHLFWAQVEIDTSAEEMARALYSHDEKMDRLWADVEAAREPEDVDWCEDEEDDWEDLEGDD